MKALRTKLSTYAIALLISCGLATPSIAGSGEFSGIYGALWAGGGGAEIDGTHTARDDTTNPGDITSGQVGGIVPLGGYEIGFNLPLGDKFFIGIGHSWVQSGVATLARGVDNATSTENSDDTSDGPSGSFHLTASDLRSVFIMPSISIFDNSAVYAKFGRTIADLELTGSASGAPNNLTGDTWAIGTIAMTPSGIFVKTEGAFTQFDDINIVGIAGSNSLVEGNPDVVQGTIALGFKF